MCSQKRISAAFPRVSCPDGPSESPAKGRRVARLVAGAIRRLPSSFLCICRLRTQDVVFLVELNCRNNCGNFAVLVENCAARVTKKAIHVEHGARACVRAVVDCYNVSTSQVVAMLWPGFRSLEVGYIGRIISNEYMPINLNAVPYMMTKGARPSPAPTPIP